MLDRQNIKLLLNEANELGCNLMIEGTTTEAEGSNALVRFSVKDPTTGMAISFPALREEAGEVTIEVPPLEGFLDESKEYEGLLEVIIGSRYFVVTEVNVNFQKALRVESKSISVNKNKRTTKKNNNQEPTVRATGQVSTKRKQTKRPLTEAQKKELLRRKRLQEAQERKRKQQQLEQQKKRSSKKVGKNLKELLGDALGDF